jgi:hypothetical protein
MSMKGADMASPKKPRADIDVEDSTPFDGCAECRTAQPQARHQHYLGLARDYGLDGADAHILDDLCRRFQGDLERARSYAKDVKLWLLNYVTQFANMVDEETGAPLTWYEALKQNQQDLRDTYLDLEEEGRDKIAARGGWPTPGAPFVPITWDALAQRRAEAQRTRQARRKPR